MIFAFSKDFGIFHEVWIIVLLNYGYVLFYPPPRLHKQSFQCTQYAISTTAPIECLTNRWHCTMMFQFICDFIYSAIIHMCLMSVMTPMEFSRAEYSADHSALFRRNSRNLRYPSCSG
jgi:hypothetical protein